MAPKLGSQYSLSNEPRKKAKTVASKLRYSTLAPSPSPPLSQSGKRVNPLSAPPAFEIDGKPIVFSQKDVKGKGKQKEKEKAKEVIVISEDEEELEADNRLWTDIYEPTTEAELAVHKKKYEDVRSWLNDAFDGGPSGKLKKYRRILALTGPSGTAKTTTIRVLSKEMDFDILEWSNPSAERIVDDPANGQHPEALFSTFSTFLERAAAGTSTVFAYGKQARRRIILLEDLPNILHSSTQTQFHEALQGFALSNSVPLVIIISDVGLKGEASDERLNSGSFGKDNDGAVDIRTVFPRELLNGPYVTEISFNPIAVTLMRKALQALLTRHFSGPNTSQSAPASKEFLDIIVESSNGDIRSAVMAMQFSCIISVDKKTKSNKRKRQGDNRSNTRAVLEAVTRREQGLVLFHLMGRLLFNKRKGDPPIPSAKTKDIARDKETDASLHDLPKLPKHLREDERRRSRVDVNNLYSDSPIDSSLYSLYIHQNYTQFCNDLEECEGIAETLSAVDASGGEAWYQANPHRFHMLTLGTLHALPSPVSRRGQKIYKPDFFDFLKQEKDAWDGVRDVGGWIVDEGVGKGLDWRAGGWSKREIAMELGGILKALDKTAPSSHRSFSRMVFDSNGTTPLGLQPLGEQDVERLNDVPNPDERDLDGRSWLERKDGEKEEVGWWVESDDIDEFD